MTPTIQERGEVRLAQHERWKLAQARLGMNPPKHAPIVLPDEVEAEERERDRPNY